MKEQVKYLVIHCTATQAGREVLSDEIRRWHLSPPPAGRGWSQVGYTDLVHINGAIERLVQNNDDAFVDPWEITNGVAGINSVSRHIVYAGGLLNGKSSDTRTSLQKEAMRLFVLDIIKKIPTIKVAGHNQFAAKDCPCFNVSTWLEEIGVKPQNIYQK
jgi:hypothetical protein